MSYHTKFKIGEFSQFMQVTVKTLRHYEQKGLLVPDETDPWTGYRYYSLAQMQKLASIRNLQRLGFSLDEIKDLYEESEHVPSIVQIDDKIRSTEAQIAQLEMRLRRLLLLRDSRKEIKTMNNFTIQPLPEIIVASHRETIPDYAALGPLCYEKIGPEMQRLGCKCPTPGYCFTIDHNKEYRLRTSTSNTANRWRKCSPIPPSSSSSVCRKCPKPSSSSTWDRTNASMNRSPRPSDTWRNTAFKWRDSHASRMSTAFGIRKTPRSGCRSSRFPLNNVTSGRSLPVSPKEDGEVSGSGLNTACQ